MRGRGSRRSVRRHQARCEPGPRARRRDRGPARAVVVDRGIARGAVEPGVGLSTRSSAPEAMLRTTTSWVMSAATSGSPTPARRRTPGCARASPPSCHLPRIDALVPLSFMVRPPRLSQHPVTNQARIGRMHANTGGVSLLRPRCRSFVLLGDSRAGRVRIAREEPMHTSRLQLALNVTDLDAATEFYRDVRDRRRRSSSPATPTSRSPTRRSSSSCSKTRTRIRRSTISASRCRSSGDVAAAAQRFTGGGPPELAGRRPTGVATPCRTRCGWTPPTCPSGAWEFYTVLADGTGEAHADDSTACCTSIGSESTQCCAGPEA